MGEHHHRAWVGPPDYFDRLGAAQFVTLILLGMRETHSLLDIGCGSLRGGRFSLLYLNKGNYYGLEPEKWCLERGIAAEVGQDLIRLKCPSFGYRDDFDASHFKRKFDYILASGIFMHTGHSQLSSCLKKAAGVLKRGGLFIGAYLEGDTDSDWGRWTYPEIQHFRTSTIRSAAEVAGLEIMFPEIPHPLNHNWFVASLPASAGKLRQALQLNALSWSEYLACQIAARGGIRRPYEDYLKEELAVRLSPGDKTVVPQVHLK
jgi:SAM-dependent methyltransferase